MPFQPNQIDYTMTNTKKINARTMEVQPKPCRTCPFAGERPIKLTIDRLVEITQNLQESTHLCHSANNRLICRGGREIQLRWLYLKGFISEPTDAALNEAFDKYLSD
jgi:hypothetical protein